MATTADDGRVEIPRPGREIEQVRLLLQHRWKLTPSTVPLGILNDCSYSVPSRDGLHSRYAQLVRVARGYLSSSTPDSRTAKRTRFP